MILRTPRNEISIDSLKRWRTIGITGMRTFSLRDGILSWFLKTGTMWDTCYIARCDQCDRINPYNVCETKTCQYWRALFIAISVFRNADFWHMWYNKTIENVITFLEWKTTNTFVFWDANCRIISVRLIKTGTRRKHIDSKFYFLLNVSYF